MSHWLGGSRTIAGGAGGLNNIFSRIVTGKTPANDSADNTKLADMAGGTVKGKPEGAAQGDPEDLTAAQVLAILEADTPLASQADLDAEAATRGGADTTLQDNIDAETAARIADVDAEETARIAADAALQSAVDDVVSDLAAHDALGVSAAHGAVAIGDLAFDPATQAELDAVAALIPDLKVATGTYTGNGTGQTVNLGVTPVLLIVQQQTEVGQVAFIFPNGATARQYPRVSTSAGGGATSTLTLNGSSFTTNSDADGMNKNGQTYRWVAVMA